MVQIIRLLSVAAIASLSSAAPLVRRDSAIGIEDGGVSAPDGVVLSNGTPTSDGGSYETSKSDNGNSYDGGNKYDNKYDNKYQPPKQDESSSYYPPPQETSNSYYPPPQETSNSYYPPPQETSSSYYQETSSGYYPPPQETSSMYESSSEYTPPPMMESSSSMMMESSSSMEESSTTSAYMSYSTPSYGSGGNSWGGNGYNDCVMQCAASYSMATGTWSPPTATQDSKDSSMYMGSGGSNGVTHTIIVAPSQGVFRYVPFATNASVGDTVTFQWGAGPHTVTQSSALEVCNKTDLSTAFAPSGKQNAGFNYDMVVNDTKPIWFYCGVPGHCEKGMFGGINIGQPTPQGESVPLGSVVVNMTESNSDMKAMYGYTKSKTDKNAYANNWGMGINVAGMDPNAMMETMKNVLWTQTLIAANPDTVDKDKGFQVTNKNMTIPADLGVALASSSGPANAGAAPAASDASGSPAPAASQSTAAAAGPGKNAATSVTSSSMALGFVVIVASFLML